MYLYKQSRLPRLAMRTVTQLWQRPFGRLCSNQRPSPPQPDEHQEEACNGRHAPHAKRHRCHRHPGERSRSTWSRPLCSGVPPAKHRLCLFLCKCPAQAPRPPRLTSPPCQQPCEKPSCAVAFNSKRETQQPQQLTPRAPRLRAALPSETCRRLRVLWLVPPEPSICRRQIVTILTSACPRKRREAALRGRARPGPAKLHERWLKPDTNSPPNQQVQLGACEWPAKELLRPTRSVRDLDPDLPLDPHEVRSPSQTSSRKLPASGLRAIESLSIFSHLHSL